MRPVLVVMPAVDVEDMFEAAAAEDEDSVEAVGAECSYPACGVGGRSSSQTSANRFRTARYANDQSKRPSPRPRQQNAEPSRMSVDGERHEFANPTRNL